MPHLLANRRHGTTRAVTNLLSSHHGSTAAAAYALRRRDYEFSSCSNSSAGPSSFSSSRRRLPYFPCLSAAAEEDERQYDGYDSLSLPIEPAPPLARIDYRASVAASSPRLMLRGRGDGDLTPEDEEEEEYVYACASSSSSPVLLLPGAANGEFSVRVSNYSSEDEAAGCECEAMDADTEDFIRRFYDQLRSQNTHALLPYYMQQESVASSS